MSLDEVATFGTDAKMDPLEKDDVSGSGVHFDKDCFSRVYVLCQFNLRYFITGLEVRTGTTLRRSTVSGSSLSTGTLLTRSSASRA